MAEDLSILRVVAADTAGRLWETDVNSAGVWSQFVEVPTALVSPDHNPAVEPPYRVTDVDCARCVRFPEETTPAGEGLWVFVARENAAGEPKVPLLLERDEFVGWRTAAIPALPACRRVAITLSPGVFPSNHPTKAGQQRAYVHLAVIADAVTPSPATDGRIIATIVPNEGLGAVPAALDEVQTSGAGEAGPATSIALSPVYLPTTHLDGQETGPGIRRVALTSAIAPGAARVS